MDAAEPGESKEESRKRRLSVKHRRAARDLENIFSQDTIDWDVFLACRIRLEDLNPNFVDPPTLITTLHRAAYDNQFQIVDWCLERGGDVDARSSLGRTPLHMACDADSVRVIRQLLEHRADPNCLSLSLMTPLHISCQCGSHNAVSLLLDARDVIDVNAQDSKNRTPDLLTKDKRIIRMIAKYRTKLDQTKKQDLLNTKLARLFKVFDRDGTGTISLSEWRYTQKELAKYFACQQDIDDDNVQETFLGMDKDGDEEISWDEFRENAFDMLEGVGMNFNTVMSSVADLENSIFVESCTSRSEKATAYMKDISEFDS